MLPNYPGEDPTHTKAVHREERRERQGTGGVRAGAGTRVVRGSVFQIEVARQRGVRGEAAARTH